MKLSGNTILITGGATGVGFALAGAFIEHGNTVIICGRRKDRLLEARETYPGLHVKVSDVSDGQSREDLLSWVKGEFPDLNMLVNNAGVQHLFNFIGGESRIQKAEEEIATNLHAPIILTSMFLPLLATKKDAAVVNVSSGLAFTPIADMPIYCATKAAVHSLTLSLRHQLRDSTIKVFEIILPIVQSELGAGHRPKAMNDAAMPADIAAADIMKGIEKDVPEIVIGDAETLYNKRDALFGILNRS